MEARKCLLKNQGAAWQARPGAADRGTVGVQTVRHWTWAEPHDLPDESAGFPLIVSLQAHDKRCHSIDEENAREVLKVVKNNFDIAALPARRLDNTVFDIAGSPENEIIEPLRAKVLARQFFSSTFILEPIRPAMAS